jgi:FHS family L-fucose permease-like MFS transporter
MLESRWRLTRGVAFRAYPIASLTYAGWVLRKFGYKATFMLGLTLYGIGALLFWPAAMKRSFGVGFS